MVYPQVGHTNGGQPWRRIKSQPRSMLPTSRAPWRCLPHCGHPHLPVVKCRGTGRSQLLLEPAAVTVKRLPRRVGDSPRRSGVCPTTAWCGVRLTALEHPRCGHPHLPVVKCRVARTGRSQLLLEPAAVTVKRFPCRVGDSPRRSGVCPTTAWCGVRLTALEHPRCGHPHAPVVKCRVARTGRSQLLLEPAAVTVKRFPCRVGDSPRRSGVCPTTAWCGVRLTALEHPRCGHPHAPVVKCRGARTGRSQLLLEPAAVTVKRFPCRVGDSPRRSGVCPTPAWCGVRLTALEHPRCGHPHAPVVKCRVARTGRSQLLLEPAAVTVKRFPCRVGDSPRRSGVCPTPAWCGVRLTALEHPRCGHPHAPVVKCRVARTGRSQLLLEPAAVTVKRFPCRVGDSPRRSGVCPTTAWCGVRLTALEHPRCGHPHAPVVKCRGARTGRSQLLLEPAAVTVKRFPCRVGDSPRRSGVCPTTAWCGVRLTALEHPRCGHPHLPVVKCRGARTGRSQLLLEPAVVTVKRFPCRVGDSPRRSGVCPTTAWCGVRLTALEHLRCGHPHLPVCQMSRCSDGSVATAAGARRGDGQTVPVPRGRLASSIGCVSHHRMVWGPPHRARTPALRPPTLARVSNVAVLGRVAAAAGARRSDGQTVPASRGRLAASIGCVSHHRMVWGPPHRARKPALRPPTLARV